MTIMDRIEGTEDIAAYLKPDDVLELMRVAKRQAREIERLRAVILATRSLVSEAALTGFNCKDGDWAERLFANQATLTAALKIERQKAPQQFQSA